ncbi:heterokaryon incompatibility protein-domain-containing protein [Cercophora newfieldiana]|uniref:Heterokaryon incompatibility protein-domain-containing protein n=1 Tax=Cercophora newfieldiana TaxID=92897 RepID=A0AA39YAM4_9PEZI|nr:heterokaryon incompatibility protein-domain-containing protein [Cercophora newfieldiana]
MGGACSTCSALPQGLGLDANCRDDDAPDDLRQLVAPHHSTFDDLSASADRGCQVCGLFRTALLQDRWVEPPGQTELTPAQAEDRHRELDKPPDERDPDLDPPFSYACPASFFVKLDTCLCLWGNDPHAPPCHAIAGLQIARCYVLNQILGLSRHCKPEQHLIDGTGWCRIGLSSSTNDVMVRGWGLLGTFPPPKTDFGLAKTWIQDCIDNHGDCPKPSLSLPARILDVGTPGTADIRLLANDSKAQGHYAALSYCWGQRKPLKLAEATYAKFVSGFPYTELPKTFQDAVSATWSLGLKYLWIDSLCIIQDSKADWEAQCSQMADIYAGSFVTLAADASKDCESGFLTERKTPTSVSAQLPGNSQAPPITLFAYRNSTGENLRYCLSFRFRQDHITSPLFKRAWVFQEMMLSGRVLHFDAYKTLMECWAFTRTEMAHFPIIANRDRTHVENTSKASFSKIMKNASTTNDWYLHWLDLLQDYAGRQLTIKADRLPALSGLASRVHRVTGDRYLAGVWMSHLPEALIWTEDVPREHWEPTEYIAPSWSWASANRPGLRWVAPSEDAPSDSVSLAVVEALLEPEGHDPFGAVKRGARLVVTGKLLSSCAVRLNKVGAWQLRPKFSRQALGERDIWMFFWDSQPSSALTSVKWRQLHILLISLETSPGEGTALVLERVGGVRATYRRVGLARKVVYSRYLYRHQTDILVASQLELAFATVKTKTIHLI